MPWKAYHEHRKWSFRKPWCLHWQEDWKSWRQKAGGVRYRLPQFQTRRSYTAGEEKERPHSRATRHALGNQQIVYLQSRAGCQRHPIFHPSAHHSRRPGRRIGDPDQALIFPSALLGRTQWNSRKQNGLGTRISPWGEGWIQERIAYYSNQPFSNL